MNIYITERGLFSNDRHDYPISHANPVNKVEAPDKVSDNRSVIRETEQAYVAENTPAYSISISSMGRAALQSMTELSKDFDEYYDQLATDYLNDRTSEQSQADRTTDDTSEETGIQGGVQDTAQNGVNNPVTQEPFGNESVSAVTNDLDTRIQEEVYEPVPDDSVQSIYDNAVSDVENEELFEETEGTLETGLVEEPGVVDVVEEPLLQEELEQPVQLADVDEVEPGADRLLQPTIEERAEEEQIREEERPENNPVIRQAMAAYNYQMSFAVNLAMTQ